MLEIGTSGTVRGGDGNIPTYSAIDLAQRPEIGLERSFVGEPAMIAEEVQATGVMRRGQHLQKQPAKQCRENLHGQKIVWAARDPRRSIGREAATRHDHVNMRVVAPTPTIP